MKLQCERNDLVRVVRLINRACSLVPSAGVTLSAGDVGMAVSGNNNSVRASALCPATVEKPGSTVVAASWLLKMLACFPAGPVILEVDEDGCRSSGGITVVPSARTLRLGPNFGESAPAVVSSESPSVTVDGMQLVTAIRKAARATSKGKMIRPALRHLCVEAFRKNLWLVGCDGSRIAIITTPVLSGYLPGKQQRLVPPSVLERLLSTLKSEEQVRLEFRPEGRLAVIASAVAVELSSHPEPYSDWRKIIKQISSNRPTTTVTVKDKDSFLRLLAAARTALDNVHDRFSDGALFVFKDGWCRVTAEGLVASVTDRIAAGVAGKAIALCINPGFLYEAVESVPGESVRLLFTTPTSPILIMGKRRGGVAAVMPMRGMEEKLEKALAA